MRKARRAGPFSFAFSFSSGFLKLLSRFSSVRPSTQSLFRFFRVMRKLRRLICVIFRSQFVCPHSSFARTNRDFSAMCLYTVRRGFDFCHIARLPPGGGGKKPKSGKRLAARRQLCSGAASRAAELAKELRGWLECEALLSHAETREGLGRCLRLGAQVRGQLSDGNIALRRTEHHSIWVIQPGDPDVFI